MATDSQQLHSSTRRAVIAADGDDARLQGDVWHKLECPCLDCVFARKDHADRIAEFTKTQLEPTPDDTQRLIDEYNVNVWGMHKHDCECPPCCKSRQATDDLNDRLGFAAYTRRVTPAPPGKHPAILTRSDGETVVYAGKVSSIYGEPSGGKSWIGLMVAIEAIRKGGRAMWWDAED